MKLRLNAILVPPADDRAFAVRLRRIYTGMSVYCATFTAVFLWVPIASGRTHPVSYFAAAFFAIQLAIAMCGRAQAVGLVDGYDHGARETMRSALAAASAAEQKRLAEMTPCQISIEKTQTAPGEGFLYILKFSTGTVKVGQTTNPHRRLSEHFRDASAYNVAITDWWLSPAHVNYLGNEVELISFCDQVCARSKREYFHGGDFIEIRRFANALAFRSAAADRAGVDA